MKKYYFLAALAALMVGCSYPAYQKMYYADFTKYAADSMLISSSAGYSGHPYVALGKIDFEFAPATGFKAKLIDPQLISDSMLDKVVQAAREKGANGVIGYSLQYIPGDKYSRRLQVSLSNSIHCPFPLFQIN